jgi:PAS domain S-box-containing protein
MGIIVNSNTHRIWNIYFINQIIDTMADGVFTLDKDGRVISWNRSMERISGHTADEPMSKTCQILKCSRCFGKQCPAGIHCCKILKEGKSEAKECILTHKTGKNIPGISQYAMCAFLDHSWPGNVRELENAIEHAFVLCNRDQIEISDLPLELRQPEEECGPGGIPRTVTKKIESAGTCQWKS